MDIRQIADHPGPPPVQANLPCSSASYEYLSATVFAPFDGKKAEILGEFVKCEDTPTLIRAIKDSFPGHPLVVYPDAACKNINTINVTLSDHNLLKKAGFIIQALRKNPLVKDSISSVNALFRKDTLHINQDMCPELVSALEQQTYRNYAPKKQLGLYRVLDTMGYRFHYNWPLAKAQLNYRDAVAEPDVSE